MNVSPISSVNSRAKSNGSLQSSTGHVNFKSKLPDDIGELCSLAEKYDVKIEYFDGVASLQSKISRVIDQIENSPSSDSGHSDWGSHSLTAMDEFMLTNLNF